MPTQIDLIKKYKLSVRGHLGQHLLLDPNLQRKIVEELELKKSDFVIEIGPGLGALTQFILQSGCRLLAVEKDPRFAEILRTEWKPAKGGSFGIAVGDILKTDLLTAARAAGWTAGKWKVVGNLPYYITAPIIFRLLEYRDSISTAVLTVQKEVGNRLAAVPGNKDYGRMTLGVRYAADVRKILDLSPSCFTPKPAVASCAVRMDFHEKKNDAREAHYFELVRIAFSQRRKTLLSLLAHAAGGQWKREDLLGIFEALGLSHDVRGEELLIKDYLALVAALEKIGWPAKDR